MLKTQEEVNKEFEKYVIKFPYSDTEELNDEHYYILKFIIKIRQDDREAIVEMIEAYFYVPKRNIAEMCDYMQKSGSIISPKEITGDIEKDYQEVINRERMHKAYKFENIINKIKEI